MLVIPSVSTGDRITIILLLSFKQAVLREQHGNWHCITDKRVSSCFHKSWKQLLLTMLVSSVYDPALSAEHNAGYTGI
jgi:hypothetical protein